ncbi:ComEC/Rec2 family competence protein [Rothia sp. P5766]|uniref:ComEC/Rec2 family competence protein n=1 Tax=Rothia sp. P5766 TaxID=3402656 RepID=UPI003ADF9AA3
MSRTPSLNNLLPGSWRKDPARKWANLVLFCLIVVLLFVLITPRFSSRDKAPADWQWITCDVGQGDAHLIRIGNSSAILLDTGDNPQALKTCLDWAGIDELEAVVLTHEHSDHYGAYSWALASLPVKNVVVSPYFASEKLNQLEGHVSRQLQHQPALHSLEQGSSVGFPLSNHRVQATAEVLWPPSEPQAIPGESDSSSWTNNTSLVMRWDIAPLNSQEEHLTVLTTGDLEAEAAHSIITNYGSALPSAVLKVAHHGSRGSGTDLIIAVKPQLAVVSVGQGNSYGHPHPSIMEFLEKQRIATKRTDQQGHIAVSSHDDGLHLITSR